MRESFANIEKLHNILAKRMEKRYTEMNAHVTDVDLKFVDETSFGEYLDSLSDPTLSYTFTVAPCEGDAWNSPTVWSYANTVAYEFLKLKGTPKADGPLVESEFKMLSEYITADLADFEHIWKPVSANRVSDAELETNRTNIGCMNREDSIIIVAFESHMQHASGLITIAYPKSAIEKVVTDLSLWASAN
jgi:flagellar motor switch protein FliM